MKRAAKPKPEQPKTAAEWAECRARLSCSVGKAWMRGEHVTSPGYTRADHALYEALTAIENLTELVVELSKEKR